MTDWMQDAICRGKTHLFFAPRAERPQAKIKREADAKALCAACPVSEPCREAARANDEYGIWGGEDEEVRLG